MICQNTIDARDLVPRIAEAVWLVTPEATELRVLDIAVTALLQASDDVRHRLAKRKVHLPKPEWIIEGDPIIFDPVGLAEHILGDSKLAARIQRMAGERTMGIIRALRDKCLRPSPGELGLVDIKDVLSAELATVLKACLDDVGLIDDAALQWAGHVLNRRRARTILGEKSTQVRNQYVLAREFPGCLPSGRRRELVTMPTTVQRHTYKLLESDEIAREARGDVSFDTLLISFYKHAATLSLGSPIDAAVVFGDVLSRDATRRAHVLYALLHDPMQIRLHVPGRSVFSNRVESVLDAIVPNPTREPLPGMSRFDPAIGPLRSRDGTSHVLIPLASVPDIWRDVVLEWVTAFAAWGKFDLVPDRWKSSSIGKVIRLLAPEFENCPGQPIDDEVEARRIRALMDPYLLATLRSVLGFAPAEALLVPVFAAVTPPDGTDDTRPDVGRHRLGRKASPELVHHVERSIERIRAARRAGPVSRLSLRVDGLEQATVNTAVLPAHICFRHIGRSHFLQVFGDSALFHGADTLLDSFELPDHRSQYPVVWQSQLSDGTYLDFTVELDPATGVRSFDATVTRRVVVVDLDSHRVKTRLIAVAAAAAVLVVVGLALLRYALVSESVAPSSPSFIASEEDKYATPPESTMASNGSSAEFKKPSSSDNNAIAAVDRPRLQLARAAVYFRFGLYEDFRRAFSELQRQNPRSSAIKRLGNLIYPVAAGSK